MDFFGFAVPKKPGEIERIEDVGGVEQMSENWKALKWLELE